MLPAAKNGFRLQYSPLHWLLPLKEISNIRKQRLLAFPADKLTTTKEYMSTRVYTALTWIFPTHLRGSRAVLELQLKPRASYFRATRLIHTSDYYSMHKNEQKSWRDCSNLSTNSSLVSPSRHPKVEQRPGYQAWSVSGGTVEQRNVPQWGRNWTLCGKFRLNCDLRKLAQIKLDSLSIFFLLWGSQEI